MKFLSASLAVVIFSVGAAAQDIDLSPSKKLIFKDAVFQRGSSSIDPKSYPTFEKLLAYLAARPDLAIEIGGHADNQGNPKTNRELSQSRADAVKAFLVQRGVKATRIFSKGYGDTEPLADNATDEGRAQNRRIEVVGVSSKTERNLTSETGTAISPDGAITAIQREVRARAPWENDWSRAALQQPVYEYHKINTASASRSTVTFVDQSTLQIGENALVVIYGTAPPKANKPVQDKPVQNVGLLSGDLYVKLAAARRQPPLSIRTRAAEIALDNSAGKIGSDAKGRSLVSMHRGASNVRGLKLGVTFEDAVPLPTEPITVPDNFGTRIAENTPPESPRLLPNPPTLVAPTAPVESPVQFQWRNTAAQTRVDISKDDSFDNLIFTATSSAESVSVSLDVGTYFLRTTSIDSIGLESKPFVRTIEIIGREARQIPLTLRSPVLERGTTTDDVVFISGKTQRGVTVFVNGDSVAQADDNGAVNFSVKLKTRFNDFAVVAKDNFNTPARQTLSIEYLAPKRWYGFLGLSVSAPPSALYGNGALFRGGVEYKATDVFILDAEALAGRVSGLTSTSDIVLLGAGVGASAHLQLDWASPFIGARISAVNYQGIGVAVSPALGGGVRFNTDAIGFVLFGRYNFLSGGSFQEQLGATRLLEFGINLTF